MRRKIEIGDFVRWISKPFIVGRVVPTNQGKPPPYGNSRWVLLPNGTCEMAFASQLELIESDG
jgi:hypothetical protein